MLCALIALLFLPQWASAQGYLVQRLDKATWVNVNQSGAGDKAGENFGPTEAGGSSTVTYRINNTSSSTKNFSGYLIGTLGAEGDFSQSGITNSNGGLGGTSVAAGTARQFTITYSPTCPGDFRVSTLTGTSGTSSFSMNLIGSAADSNGLIVSLPSEGSKIGTTIADSSNASEALRTDFGDVAVGGGGLPDVNEDVFFALRNFSNGGSSDNAVGYSNARITGTHASDFSIISLPDGILESDMTANKGFVIRFNPSATGERNATFQVKLTDSDIGADDLYTFALAGRGTGTYRYTVEGSADVSPRNYNAIADEDDSPRISDGTEFPATTPGAGELNTYIRITNTGDVALDGEVSFNLSEGPDVLKVVGDGKVSVAPGASQVFTLAYDPEDARETRGIFQYLPEGKRDDYTFTVSGEATGPEIQVVSETGELLKSNPDGTTPSNAAGTKFVAAIGGSVTRTFTLRNIGNADMEVFRGIVLGTNGPFDWKDIDRSNFTLPPNGTRTFTITYSPQNVGDTIDKTFQIQTDDDNESNFEFTLSGSAVGQPELRVRGVFNNSTIAYNIDDTPLDPADQNVTNYGAQTDPFSRRFRILNDGDDTLSITNVSISPANPRYSIIDQTGNSVSPNGSGVDFRVLYTPDGPQTNDIGFIQVATNDPDEPLYTFAVTTTVVLPQIQIFGGEALDVAIENGDRSPDVEDGTIFPVRNPQAGTNNAFSRLFRYRNIGNADFTLQRIYFNAPEGEVAPFSIDLVGSNDTLAPGADREFVVNFHPQTSGTFSTNIAILGRGEAAVAEGAGTSFQVSGIGADPNATPVLQISAPTGGSPILTSNEPPSIGKGTQLIDLTPGSVVTQTFTVSNESNQRTLELEAPTFAGFDEPYSVSLADLELAPGETTTLDVTFDTRIGEPGAKRIFIRIDSNDPNSDPFIISFLATLPTTPGGDVLSIRSIQDIGGKLEMEFEVSGGPARLMRSTGLEKEGWEQVLTGVVTGTDSFEIDFRNEPIYFYRLER